jgi:hypothetical protein
MRTPARAQGVKDHLIGIIDLIFLAIFRIRQYRIGGRAVQDHDKGNVRGRHLGRHQSVQL